MTTVICTVIQGKKPLYFKWLKDGKEISENFNVKQTTVGDFTSFLSIENLNRNHSGNYTCTVNSPSGMATMTSSLSVFGKSNNNNPFLYCKHSSKY